MKKVIKSLLLLLWLILIFCLSEQTRTPSNNLSSGILATIGNIINLFIKIDIGEFVLRFGTLIRKMAHFFEYFVLYILSYSCFKEYGIKKMYIAFIFCVICASFDEIHQLFVDGRSCQISDVCIDSLGSLLSLSICHLIKRNDRNIDA